jgi:hypothetical protein
VASNYKKELIFLLERTWDDNNKLPEKYKFQETNTQNKAKVHIDSGTLGMEFFLEQTLPEFNQAGTRLDWSWLESFLEFENVLGNGYCTNWPEVLSKHFPEPFENKPKATCESKNCDKEEHFYHAISLFICEILGDKKLCDRQYIYMQLGGDYPFQKDLMTPPCMHTHCFKKMLRTTKALTASNMPKPSDALLLQWYWMSFYKNDRNKFVTAGKKLKTKMLGSITKFFKAQFNQNKVDGMLECMELERIKKHAHLKLKSKLRDKIHMREDKRCTYRAKRKLVSPNAKHCSYGDCNDSCRYIKHDCNCDYDNEP